MIKNPSIFNDVIGPVMRGPSSSHTAASWRIARVCLDILNEPIKKALIDFDKHGAWASNYREQGTVMGINGGLLGLDITDNRMKQAEVFSNQSGVEIRYKISSFPTKHTNTVRLTLEGQKGKRVQILAASTGGGAFKIQQIDHFPASIRGDYFEMLIRHQNNISLPQELLSLVPKNAVFSQTSDKNNTLINIKSSTGFPPELMNRLKKDPVFNEIIIIDPILPVVSGNGKEISFTSIASLLEYAENNQLDIGEAGLLYESCRSGLSDEVLITKMHDIIQIIGNSIKTGLKGTVFKDRILAQQSHLIKNAEKKGRILKNPVVNNIIANISAIMEAKSAMEVIVANPTAGSCGTIGGLLKTVSDELYSTPEELVKAYFACGIIGIFLAKGPGFSAEEYGCQVECGAASGMAAAGIVQLLGGTVKQAVDAASIAIQNMLGLICDPVADRVEVPCLGKNISAAMNALSSATMACAGFDAVIPLEEVIQSVGEVGEKMPVCVKCTGKGGLAVTPTATRMKDQLKKNN